MAISPIPKDMKCHKTRMDDRGNISAINFENLKIMYETQMI